jgi:membrane-associated protein
METVIDLFLHSDKYLGVFVQGYGVWIYLFLFLIIFAETGFVFTPFLPGDSLLFAAGALSSVNGSVNIFLAFVILIMAAILGDTVNYWIGHFCGPKIFHKENVRFLDKKRLEQARMFYEKYGGKTIILARFVPFLRTFAPFVAGIGRMDYKKFILYNIAGGIAWVSIFIFGGYFFGSIAPVQKNFTLVVLAIIFISILPIVIGYIRQKAGKLSS